MRRRDLLATTSVGVAALAGCFDLSDAKSSETVGANQTTGGDPSPTASGTRPAYATCETEAVSSTLPESARTIPDSLSHEHIVAYVESVERQIVLPVDTDGYLNIGDISTESVAHGHLAHVPVTGGYYNEASDDSTETIHYDVGSYTASYFLTEHLVRRAKARDGSVDPRKQGALIVCAAPQ